jgi:hypothetical protein
MTFAPASMNDMDSTQTLINLRLMLSSEETTDLRDALKAATRDASVTPGARRMALRMIDELDRVQAHPQ